MKNKIITGIIVIFFLLLSYPIVIAEEASNAVDEKSIVYIKGESHQYKFGSFVHIGKMWWCPNYNIKLVFDVDDSFLLFIDGQEQTITSKKVSISMDGFFGIAPTLYSFLTSDSVRVFGVCDDIIIEKV